MNLRSRPIRIHQFFPILLLLLFLFCTITLISTGLKVYQNGTSHLEDDYTIRTACAYVTEQIHQHDGINQISVRTLSDLPVLCLTDTISDTRFYTCIYCYDGYLRELSIRDGIIPAPEMGTPLVELRDFQCSFSDSDSSLLVIQLTGTKGDCYSNFYHFLD